MASRRKLLKLLKESGPLSIGQVASQLGSSKGLRKLLEELEGKRLVKRASRGRYQLAKLPKAVDSDGELPDRIVGILHKEGRHWTVAPIQMGLKADFSVSPSKLAKQGDLVVVELRSIDGRVVVGTIEQRVVYQHEAERAAKAHLLANAVKTEFSAGALTESVSSAVTNDDLAGRRDLRDLSFITIDGPSAKDFDDAVYASADGSDGWRLIVAIADVAHYVKQDTELDREAKERGTSIYLPDRVIPMLPEKLSNGICSLRPHEDRLALVCEMHLSATGDVLDSSFHEAVIKSRARLTYSELADYFAGRSMGRSSDIRESVNALYAVFKLLHAQRLERGALDFDTVETNIALQEGRPVGVHKAERNDAHRLIEEIMIQANVTAAKFIRRNRGVPLYRVHASPDTQAVEELRHILGPKGVEVPAEINEPRDLRAVLEAVRLQSNVTNVWEVLVIRSMKQARYDPSNIGHFGLALSDYVHFTSPIRRYPDLVVHRLIKEQLRVGKIKERDSEGLAQLAQELSEREQRANVLSRKIEDWLKASLLSKRLGEIFEGTISGIARFGFFVELDEYFVSGLVHVRSLANDYFDYDGVCLQGEVSGKRYSLGDRVRVKIVAVDPPRGLIDLMDVDNMATKIRKSHTRKQRQNKRYSGRRRGS